MSRNILRRALLRLSRPLRTRTCKAAILLCFLSLAVVSLGLLDGFGIGNSRHWSPTTSYGLTGHNTQQYDLTNTSNHLQAVSTYIKNHGYQKARQNASKGQVSSDSRQPRTAPLNTTTSAPNARNFAKKYRHPYGKNTKQLFSRLQRIMKQDWKPDVAKTREFRADIRTELGKAGSPGNFLLTKNNTSPRAKMRFYMAGKARNMTPSLWSYLPQNAIFKQGQFASCSVVGSSGILRGSRCGKKIDQSQFVSRLNGLKTQTNCSHFGNILKQFKDSKLWLPMFGASVYFSTLKRTMVTATEFQSVRPVLGHPDHFLSVSKLWRKTIGNNRLWPTTGLYLVLSLVDVCDRINVFGFWPYSTTINGSDVPYHYHNDVTGKKNLHSFDTEFKTLVNLYEKGIINMHFGACL